MKRSRWGLLMVGFFLTAAAAGCSPALSRHEFGRPEMGTTFRVVVYCPDEESAKAAADAAFHRIHQLNATLSDYLDTSELSRLSDTAGSGRAVPVSEDLWNVLERAQQLAQQTGGAFDVTVGPLVYRWRKARRLHELPDPRKLEETRRLVGYQNLRLDPAQRTATLTKPGMRLDLGGIAKGYAADQALKLLRERGVSRALVAAAGDIAVGDPPPGREAWKIAVDPFGELDTPAAGREIEAPPHHPPQAVRYLLLRNAAVSTSGDIHQHVDIGGKRYSHIVDPSTGIGLTTPLAVTVVAADATTTDALATAFCVMGEQKTEQAVEGMPGVAALMAVMRDGTPVLKQTRRAAELKFAPRDGSAK